MSRDDGFAVMDLDTDFFNDVKVKRLIRHAPARAPMAITAYIAVATASWRVGRRLAIEDTWPSGLPLDQLAIDALRHVGMIDARGSVMPRTWRGWYEKARQRRDKSREDWREWQRKHRERQGSVRADSDPDKSIPSVYRERIEESNGVLTRGTTAQQGLSVENEPTPIGRRVEPVKVR